jgi:hypothetical protein
MIPGFPSPDASLFPTVHDTCATGIDLDTPAANVNILGGLAMICMGFSARGMVVRHERGHTPSRIGCFICREPVGLGGDKIRMRAGRTCMRAHRGCMAPFAEGRAAVREDYLRECVGKTFALPLVADCLRIIVHYLYRMHKYVEVYGAMVSYFCGGQKIESAASKM